MRYFLHIAYDGTPFSGWQWQKSTTKTVQNVIQQNLASLLKDDTIALTGCGRTDTGVHASQYFVQLDVWNTFGDSFLFRINKLLPDPIVVFDFIKVDENASARFDTSFRRYDYFMHLHKDPFLVNRSMLIDDYNLDIPKMKSAASLIKKYNDFEFLCNNPDKHNTTLCHVSHSELIYNQGKGQLQFVIIANRFIKGMIRILSQCLIDVGRGAINIDQFESYLSKSSERSYKTKAVPEGLYLSKIEYPYLSLPNQSTGYNRLRLDI